MNRITQVATGEGIAWFDPSSNEYFAMQGLTKARSRR
jgi:hypothetical protein